MESEKKDKMQPRSDRFSLKNQRERISTHDKEPDRTPIYRAVKEENGYQVHPQEDPHQSAPSRPAAGKRPRISESQRVSYNADRYERQKTTEGRPFRPSYPASYPNASRTGQRQPPPYSGGGNYPNRPQYAGKTPGEARYPASKRPLRPVAPAKKKTKFIAPKPVKYKENLLDPNEPIRLNKFLANAGVCSRREADEFIQAGVVKVNDKVVTELGTKISRMDTVHFHDRPVHLEGKIYVLLNKPKNFITTTDDPNERRTVMDLVKHACKERIYPVGRLDRNTTGVMLLTNDGDLASKLTHPSFKKKKIYHVWLDKEVAITDMERLANGIELEDGEIHADALSYASEDDKSQVGIEIHSGRNRIVRRMFEALGYKVTKLDRVYFAGLTKKNLGRGKWRYLNEQEVNMLRIGAFE
ncbi:MAG: rRNA pseudouridine synthase [Tannerella sp.]|jgi:23S rRNA pseudouridine2605 synthase|nr:rRNA pseudouridine synthase [Tannerella sp.]